MTLTIAPAAHERLLVHGIDLEVLRRGTGRAILMLHGPHAISPRAPFLEELAGRAEAIAPSHPGFGTSARPETFDSMYDLVHLYQDVMDALPQQQVTLMGLSFGGWIAAEIAVNAPAKIDRLILVDPLGIKVGGREDADIVHVFNTHPDEVRRRAWHDPTQVHAGQFGFGWQTDINSLSDEDIVGVARDWDALCLYGWRPYMYNPKLAAWLHRITVPTLVVWGASDDVVTPAYKAAYGKLIPGARVEVIDQAGHHPEIEQPRALAKRVLSFLDS